TVDRRAANRVLFQVALVQELDGILELGDSVGRLGRVLRDLHVEHRARHLIGRAFVDVASLLLRSSNGGERNQQQPGQRSSLHNEHVSSPHVQPYTTSRGGVPPRWRPIWKYPVAAFRS